MSVVSTAAMPAVSMAATRADWLGSEMADEMAVVMAATRADLMGSEMADEMAEPWVEPWAVWMEDSKAEM